MNEREISLTVIEALCEQVKSLRDDLDRVQQLRKEIGEYYDEERNRRFEYGDFIQKVLRYELPPGLQAEAEKVLRWSGE